MQRTPRAEEAGRLPAGGGTSPSSRSRRCTYRREGICPARVGDTMSRARSPSTVRALAQGRRQPCRRDAGDAAALAAAGSGSSVRRQRVEQLRDRSGSGRSADARPGPFARADSQGDRGGTARLHLRRGAFPGDRQQLHARGSREGVRTRAGPDRADGHRDRISRAIRGAQRGGRAADVLRGGRAGRRLSVGGDASADPGPRAGDRADRRCAGPAVSPLRPRAADALGLERNGGRGADGGPLQHAASARLAGDGPDPSALPATSSSRTSWATWSQTSTALRSTWGGCASRSRSPT